NYPGSQQVLLNALSQVFPINFFQVWPNKGSTQNFPQDNTILDKRILVDQNMSVDKLMSTLANSNAKQVPYVMGQSHGEWLSTWGQLSWSDSGMTIGATKSDTGSGVFLDGARDWTSYAANATMKLKAGDWGKLMLRYQDDNNYIACTYSQDGVLMDY